MQLDKINWCNHQRIQIVKQSKKKELRKFLVFIRSNGDKRAFLDDQIDSDRNYDLAFSYFAKPLASDIALKKAEYICTGGLSKFHAAKLFIEELDLLNKYEGIWFVDDDISFPQASIDRYLEYSFQNGFDLCQPSLAPQSFYSHDITLNHPSFIYRITNFVEVMFPYFSARALKLVLHTFDQSISSWGLDFLWPKILKDAKIGILDLFIAVHTKPIKMEGAFYTHLKSIGIDPVVEMNQVNIKNGITEATIETLSFVQPEIRYLFRFP
jgi:hypothetical protein